MSQKEGNERPQLFFLVISGLCLGTTPTWLVSLILRRKTNTNNNYETDFVFGIKNIKHNNISKKRWVVSSILVIMDLPKGKGLY